MENNYQNPYGEGGNNYVSYEPSEEQTGGKKGLAIASLIVGILIFLTGCIFSSMSLYAKPLMYIPIVISVIAIVLGTASLATKGAGKGMAITGIVLGALALISGAFMAYSMTLAHNAFESAGISTSELYNEIVQLEKDYEEGLIDEEEYNEELNEIIETLTEAMEEMTTE